MKPPRSRRTRFLLNFAILLSLALSIPSSVAAGNDVAGNDGAGYDPVDAGAASPAGFSCDSVTEIPRAECEVLVAFYNGTGGPTDWTSREGWLQTSTPCSWRGISCTSNRVTAISLSKNDITGAIPSELADLANLEELYLVTNNLSGAIPRELGGLSHLEYLRLDDNALTGVIPTEISDIVSLSTLLLGSNQLYGSIPSELGQLTELQLLDLSTNRLTGTIPPSIGNLTNLEYLYLAENRIGGSIPPELGRLTNLRVLLLRDMELSGAIPRELGDLSSLGQLALANNHLQGPIPPELTNLANLDTLWLSNNNLSGSLPSAMGNLRKLDHLGLSDNALAGPLPSTMTQLSPRQFEFSHTFLCEPGDATFQSWLGSIATLSRTNIICSSPQARGYVFLDSDEDGTRDASETEGLEGIHVYVTQGGSRVRSAFTIDAGWYEFHDLPESYLCVKPEIPAGYALTTQAERCSSFAYGYIVDAYFGIKEEPVPPTPTPTATPTETPDTPGVWLPMIVR